MLQPLYPTENNSRCPSNKAVRGKELVWTWRCKEISLPVPEINARSSTTFSRKPITLLTELSRFNLTSIIHWEAGPCLCTLADDTLCGWWLLLSLSIYVHTIFRINLTRTTYEMKEFNTYKNSTHAGARITTVKKKGCKRSRNSLRDGKTN